MPLVLLPWLQAGEDAGRLSSLQEQVMSLSQQVQQLQPLQPKLSTAEVERDTALHKLERLQVGCVVTGWGRWRALVEL